jgi:ATP-binding cassette subfamily F protein 3
MLSKSNLLILDEPTNHLDLESIEAIEKALVDFDGTIMVVSHDRYFLNKVVDRYLAVLDENLIPFDSYQDYLDANHSQAKQGTTSKYKNEAQVRREQNKEFQRELKRKQRRLEQTETEIEELETEKEKVSDLLNDPSIYADYNKSLALSKDLAEIETKLAEAYRVWEELSIELSANKVE